MLLLELTLFLLLCSVALGWVARHFNFPYPIALVIGGAVLGFAPRLPQFPFDPQLILVIVLPPILYQAALMTSWGDFKANIRPIGLLAIGLVIVTTLAVGAALKLVVPDVPWAVAFVLGAIVSPPDAVAATSILSRLNIPRRVVTVLEGESLVNDASGLVLYKFAVAAVLTGTFSLTNASLQFVAVAIGGVIVGLGIAHVFVAIHRHLGDPFIEVLTSLTVPYTTYIVAESLQVSGVLAVVAAGLVRGRYAPEIVSAEMRILARSVWNILVFMLNSLIFMLIGILLSDVLENLTRFALADLITWGVLISTVAIAVRFAWIYPVTYLQRVLSGSKPAELKPGDSPPSAGEDFIMSWCGMRGMVSLAAALALPVVLPNGEAFPYRDLIVFLTFFVIAVTLVGQGLTLPWLIRKLKVGSDWSMHEEQQRVRLAMSRAAMASIDRMMLEQGAPNEWADPLRNELTERITLAAPAGLDMTPKAELLARLRRAAIKAERQELIRLWRDNEISDDVMHHLEEILDYQEAHL